MQAWLCQQKREVASLTERWRMSVGMGRLLYLLESPNRRATSLFLATELFGATAYLAQRDVSCQWHLQGEPDTCHFSQRDTRCQNPDRSRSIGRCATARAAHAKGDWPEEKTHQARGRKGNRALMAHALLHPCAGTRASFLRPAGEESSSRCAGHSQKGMQQEAQPQTGSPNLVPAWGKMGASAGWHKAGKERDRALPTWCRQSPTWATGQ